jgi:hypothetical protein
MSDTLYHIRDPGMAGASSQTTATILLVAITIILAGLVFLMFQMPGFTWEKPPSFLEIQKITSINENGILNYDSRVLLYHHGTERLVNDNLKASFFRNGEMLPCRITTMNGHNFIGTVHIGVQTMGGMGCSGTWWEPGEKIMIDFTDGTFHPGDSVRVDIFQKPANTLISSYTSLA